MDEDAPASRVDEAAAADVLRRVAELSDRLKEYIDADVLFADGLGERARAHLDGEADAVGAAATLVALSDESEFGTRFYGPDGPRYETRYDGFADAWTVRHGLAFAAEAFVELSGLHPSRVPRRDYSRCTSGVRLARPDDPMDLWREAAHGGVRRMRELMAGADGPVLERLADLRTTPVRRAVVTYLAPAREDWLDECCAAPPTGVRERDAQWMLWCSLRSAAQFERVRGGLSAGPDGPAPDVLAAVLDRIGPAPIAPVLGAVLDGGPRAAHRDAVLALLAATPADETFAVLAERAADMHAGRALATAARRFPERARRLLPAPPPAARPVPDASPDALPPLLVRPPWKRPRPGRVPRLTPPADRTVVWADGEREKWADAAKYRPESLGHDLARATERFREGRAGLKEQVAVLVHAPADVAGPLLAGWTPPDDPAWTRPLIARHELAVRDHALRVARSTAPGGRGLLVPFRDAEIAALMAGWLARRAGPQRPVRTWFGRHGAAAVPLLVPAALGGAAAPRRHAVHALRFIADRTDAAQVVEAARAHGDAAADAVRALLAGPAPVPPLRIPKHPAWAHPDVLPQILLRDRTAALPAAATAHLITALTINAPTGTTTHDGHVPGAGEAAATAVRGVSASVGGGVAGVREVCDPGSLAGFGWALFEAWRGHGAAPRHAWALEALGLLGDDDTVRRLVALVGAWPGEGLHSHAVKGLDVLAALGTPVAVLYLHEVARKGKYPGIRRHARALLEEAAKRAGVPADRLAERIVPRYGLGADGALTVDYGRRRFRAGFDERLEPFVADESGRRLKALPEPGARDDAGLASAARRRFTAMKAEVRTASAAVTEALENALARRRAWTPEEFRALFADHPLVRHIARRLVWTADGAAFRVAEDGTFADVRDDAFVLPGAAAVRVAHPLDLGDDLPAWRETFDDYELAQPFRQLHRRVHTLTGDERASGRTKRFDGVTVPDHRLRGMLSRGWTFAPGHRLTREDPGGLKAVLDLDWTFDHDTSDDVWRVGELTVDAPDPALASEALADVDRLVGPRRGAEA
ncbi:DUF4132 domain-containing protein [Actinomadura algeriensis]|uniref:DUF4132 domain-containing protein n=1 Tax=Actinomadura algeriensis TaxID=1679523 RepID=A0ABR9K4F1_9ACTN|nr:DUF4132 domain-containing protein [Actinomadura algeriensis]MBE1537483.1 hypothetical protein [Actinomadura algeriensis]